MKYFPLATFISFLSMCFVVVGNADNVPSPGRPVVVATAAIGYGGSYSEKFPMALEYIHAAGKVKADIVCLPEDFSGGPSETIPGATTMAISELAKYYSMYIICPLREKRGDNEYNTSVLIDRNGDIAGVYRKIFVFWGENVHAGENKVPYFDTDFGRISILTCFDINFPELWLQAEQNGTEILFWPSAYGGGFPLKGYAGIHAYYIVPVGDGDFIDMTGEPIIPYEKPLEHLSIARLDLDRTLVHKDYTCEKVQELLNNHKDEITLERDWHPEGWYMLLSIKAGLCVRDLCRRYDIETLREYRYRSREQINILRKRNMRIYADASGVPLAEGINPGTSSIPEAQAMNAYFANMIYSAWRRNHPMPRLSTVFPNASLDDAYYIQKYFVQRILEAEKIGGFKAAGVASQNERGPLTAVVPASQIYQAAEKVIIDSSENAPRHLENEIGYRFGKELCSPLGTVEELKTYVESIMAVVEVPGGATENYGPVSHEDLVAWNINAKALITGGAHSPSAIDPDTIDIVFSKGKECINTARGDMAAAGQWGTLLKTVNNIIRIGYTIDKGHIITNGALGTIVRAKPGSYRADYGPLGVIEFEVQ